MCESVCVSKIYGNRETGKIVYSTTWYGVFPMVLSGFAGLNKAFMLSWHIHVMDKVVFCKDCNHKASEHGVFENSDANEPHPCMRSDCGCSRYVPSE